MVKLILISIIGFNLHNIDLEVSVHENIESCLDEASALDGYFESINQDIVWECDWWSDTEYNLGE